MFFFFLFFTFSPSLFSVWFVWSVRRGWCPYVRSLSPSLACWLILRDTSAEWTGGCSFWVILFLSPIISPYPLTPRPHPILPTHTHRLHLTLAPSSRIHHIHSKLPIFLHTVPILHLIYSTWHYTNYIFISDLSSFLSSSSSSHILFLIFLISLYVQTASSNVRARVHVIPYVPPPSRG